MEQLIKDQEAVDQVKQIVEKEEAIMKQETDIVENYAKVCQETSEYNYTSASLLLRFVAILLAVLAAYQW